MYYSKSSVFNNNLLRNDCINDICQVVNFNNNKSKRLVDKRDEAEVGSNKNFELRMNNVVDDRMEKESNIQSINKWSVGMSDSDNFNSVGQLINLDEIENLKINYDKMRGRPSMEILLNGFPVTCLLDTGACVNVVDKDVIEKIGKVNITDTDDQLKCANRSRLKIIGKTSLWTELGKEKKLLNFTVVEGMSPSVIGGMSLLREFGIMLMKTAETETENSFICSIVAKFGRNITDEERFRRTTNL